MYSELIGKEITKMASKPTMCQAGLCLALLIYYLI